MDMHMQVSFKVLKNTDQTHNVILEITGEGTKIRLKKHLF